MLMIARLCRRYEVASKCVSYLLYACSDIKAKYKSKLDQFEYACSHLTTRDSMLTCFHYNPCAETENVFKIISKHLCMLNFAVPEHAFATCVIVIDV